MERIEKNIDVNCPLRMVYNQWTQFEEFPLFMTGVKEVRQLDDTHVRWQTEFWGREKTWEAEITEQVPDEHISWRSVSGAPSAGTVRFEPLAPGRTRVHVVMAYQPEGAAENIGDSIGLMNVRVRATVEDFKHFVESHLRETGGWRGEVHDGRPRRRGGLGGVGDVWPHAGDA
jgi:uncharacterized membrane protein